MRTFAEWVLPGHPDKISDRIADALVDAALRHDPRALVGVEVAVHRNFVFIDGRIACPGAETIDSAEIARDIFRESGYGALFLPDPRELEVVTDLCLSDFRPDEQMIRTISDDQNVVTGFAELNPAANYMPTAPFVARTIAQHLEAMRKELQDEFGPDGKVLVVLQSNCDSSDVVRHNLESVSFSIHHAPNVDTVEIMRLAKRVLVEANKSLEEIGFEWQGKGADVIVNGAGDFAVGGPEGDNGLSGKKLVVDAYGPMVPIGGGALSGKDPHKVDRVMALRARQIAKHLVISGAAEQVLVHLGFAPGDSEPRWQEITFGKSDYRSGSTIWSSPNEPLVQRWLNGYDLTIEGTFRDLRLETLSWRELAAWGHFWDPLLPWEQWNPGRSVV